MRWLMLPRRGLLTALACVGVSACTAGVGEAIRADAGGDPDATVIDNPDAGVADAAPPPDAAPCIEGDRQVVDGATCFFAFETPKTWDDARADCVAGGGDLARIDSQADNDVVFLLASDPLVTADWWLLGNDRLVEGRFVWGEDVVEIVDPLFEQWRSGEPNDSGDGPDGEPEDCMIIESDNPLREWDDRTCTDLHAYVCQR